MKRLSMSMVASIVVLAVFAGCQNSNKGVNVVVEDGGKFPEYLAGTWQADIGGWVLVFEPDGAISSVQMGSGRVTLRPGKVTTFTMQDDKEESYTPQPWSVWYSHPRRELTVEISLIQDRMKSTIMPMEARRRDVFIGQVSEEGDEWQAQWFRFRDYTIQAPGAPEPREITFDPNNNPVRDIVFSKIEEQG